jgi:anthranilate phosphoribosyltransferase
MTDTLLFPKVLAELESSEGLSADMARRAFDEILEGQWTQAQIAGLLIGLRAKPDSPTVVTAAAQSLRAAMVVVTHRHPKLVDTCGTGGDGQGTLNLSTGAAIMLAATGIKVAKHGNRAMSSRTGAADVLEQLGIPVTIAPRIAETLLRDVGITFLLAPTHHPAMRFAAPVRRELGVRTLFNCLGPLANPASANYQLLGAFSDVIRPVLAESLRRLGSVRAWVVHSLDGLDEISPFAPTRVTQLVDGTLSEFEIAPEDFGLERSDPGAIAGAGPDYNARVLSDVLSGRPHPSRNAFVMNAAAALAIAESIPLQDAAIQMQRVLDSGAALEKLTAWRDAAQRHSASANNAS